MPQFIQTAYNPDNSLAKAISGLGEAFAPSNGPQMAVAAANARKLQMQAELGAQMEALTLKALQGDVNAQRELASKGVRYNPEASNATQYLRYGHVQPLDANSPGYKSDASKAVLSTGGAWSSTPQAAADEIAAAAARQATQNAASIEAARARAQIDAESAAAVARARNEAELAAKGEEPVQAEGPNGPVWIKRKDLPFVNPNAPAQPPGGDPAAAPLPGAAGTPAYRPAPDASTTNQRERFAVEERQRQAEREAKAREPVAVRDKATGAVGYVPRSQFEARPDLYQPLEDASVLAAREKQAAEAAAKSKEMVPAFDSMTGQPTYASRLDIEASNGRLRPILNESDAYGTVIQRDVLGNGGGGPPAPAAAQPPAATPSPPPGAASPPTRVLDPIEAPAQPAPQGGTSLGQRLVEKKIAGTGPAQSDLGKLQSERDALPPGDPRRAEYDARIAQMTVTPGATAAAQATANRLGKSLDAYDAEYTAGRKMIDRVENIEKLLATGVGTGPVKSFLQPAIAVIAELGGPDFNQAAVAQALQGQSNAAVIDALGGSLGAQISNTDREFMSAIKPGLDKLPDANRITVALLKSAAQRQIARALEASRFAETPGASPEKLRIHMAQWEEANHAFKSPELQDALQRAKAAQGAAPAPGASRREVRTGTAAPAGGPPPGTGGTTWTRDANGNLVRQ